MSSKLASRRFVKSHRKWRQGWYLMLSGVIMITYLEVVHYVLNGNVLLGTTEDPLECGDVFGGSSGGGGGGGGSRQLLAAAEPKKDPLFPQDLFTPAELKKGAVVMHVFGVLYMFVALAIVCDEFFVPSLDVIIEKLDIAEDVAGATFMAAGGSAPELFTSAIGVFIAFSDVGISTIVGSAVFNILFVIGMCAMFSRTVLSLTWWPFFRDCWFYSVALVLLIMFFKDNSIQWWESLTLLLVYAAYVTFMKYNTKAEALIKGFFNKNVVTRVRSSDELKGDQAPKGERRVPTAMMHSGSKFRQGLLQLMIHSIDPLHQGKIDDKAHQLASLRPVARDSTKQGISNLGLVSDHCPFDPPPQQPTTNGTLGPRSPLDSSFNSATTVMSSDSLASPHGVGSSLSVLTSTGGIGGGHLPHQALSEKQDAVSVEDAEEENPPLDISWPTTNRKRLTYILLAPIVFPLWATMPDTRKPTSRKYFVITFILSILWIAFFSYLMVWWTSTVGATIGIADEVMGLTFLAAGTSIPDLMTSVIVARKGFGDMAVSSSVGSNIFDVCVGLPLPWILWSAVNVGAPVKVNSEGMACSIILLFSMLMLVFISIVVCKWRMNKALGVVMFLLYFGFVAVSLLFEYGTIRCNI